MSLPYRCEIWRSDRDQVEWNFVDATGADNPYGLMTDISDQGFNIEALQDDRRFWENDAVGGLLVKQRYGLSQSSFRMCIPSGQTASMDFDDYREALGYLGKLLDRGGVIRYQATATSEMRYILYEGSSMPGMYRGHERALRAQVQHFIDPESGGLPVVINRQPLFEGAEIDSDVNKLANATLTVDVDNNNRPDGWSWDSLTGIASEDIDADYRAFLVSLTGTDERTLSRLSAVGTVGQTWLVSGYFATDDAVRGRARVAVGFYTAGDVLIGSATASALVIPSTNPGRPTRVSVAAVAPATTAKVRAEMRIDNDSAGTVFYWLRDMQLEQVDAGVTEPTRFRVGTEVVTNRLGPHHTTEVADAFQRATTDGWGTADVGGAYTLDEGAAADFDTDIISDTSGAGRGTIISPIVATHRARLGSSDGGDFDYTTMISWDSANLAGATYDIGLTFRATNATNYYRAFARIATGAGGAISVLLEEVIAGAPAQLGSTVGTGETNTTVNDRFLLRVRCDGTAIKVKFWKQGSAEPVAWDIEVTDASFSTGDFGVFVRRNTGSTTVMAASFWGLGAIEFEDSPAHGRAFPLVIQGEAEADVRMEVTASSALAALERVMFSVLSDPFEPVPDWMNQAMVFDLVPGEQTTSILVGPSGSVNGSIFVKGLDGSPSSLGLWIGWATGGTLTLSGRVVRLEVTDAEALEALRGTFQVYLRCLPAGLAKFVAQLKYAPSLVDPSPIVLEEKVLDTTTLVTAGHEFVEMLLGTMTIPDDVSISGLGLEVWMRLLEDPGVNAALYLTHLIIVPADQVSSAVGAPTAAIHTLGKNLAGGSASGNSRVLTAAGTEVRFDVGRLAAGRHKLTFRASIQDATSTTDIRLRVTNVTDAQIEAESKLLATATAPIVDQFQKEFSIEWDAEAGDDYDVLFRLNASTATITIHSATYEQIPKAVQNEKVLTDPRMEQLEVFKLDSADDYAAPWTAAGFVPLRLPPEYCAIYASFLESRKNGIYPLLGSPIERSYSVRTRYHPKFLTL